MTYIKPIETYYKGHHFRSRLEARWAVFFDSLNIKWIYEPEGIEIDGIKYLPDFYLVDSKQFFEVKGVMRELDERKINALIKAGYSVTIGYDNGEFQSCDKWRTPPNDAPFTLSDKDGSWLCKCFDCGNYWFMGAYGSWECQCCGEYDGDHHFEVIMNGNAKVPCGYEDIWNVARQARFEHNNSILF